MSRQSGDLETRQVCSRISLTDSLTLFDLLRDTEIGNLDSASVVDQDIGSLNVSMNNVCLVQIAQTLQDLLHECPDQCFLESPVIRQQMGN